MIRKVVRATPTIVVILFGISLYQAPEWVHAPYHTKVKDALILIGAWLLCTAIAFALTRPKQQGQQRQSPGYRRAPSRTR